MRISDWSSDVCSSDLGEAGRGYPRFAAMPEGTPPQPSPAFAGEGAKSSRLKPLLQARLAATLGKHAEPQTCPRAALRQCGKRVVAGFVEVVRERPGRSEEHTSELQLLMRISYAVFCLKKKINTKTTNEN